MIMNVGFGICNDGAVQTHDYYRVTTNTTGKRLSRLLLVVAFGVLMALLPQRKVVSETKNAEQMSAQGTLRNLGIFDLKMIQQEVEDSQIHSLGQDGQEKIDVNNEDVIDSEESETEQAPQNDADAFASEDLDEDEAYNSFELNDQDVTEGETEQKAQEEEQVEQKQNEPEQQQNEPEQQQNEPEQQLQNDFELQQEQLPQEGEQQIVIIEEPLPAYSPPEPVSRLDCLEPTAHYNFVHVFLCAGTAWMHELQAVLNPIALFPHSATAEMGEFHTVPYMRNRHYADYTLLSLRSPRHQLWSIYAKCRYGHSFHELKAELWSFNDDAGFDQWLSYYVSPTDYENDYIVKESFTNDFGCIHPVNVQSRFLLSDEHTNPAHIDVTLGSEPNVTRAMDMLRSVDWVGIPEFFHASKCLLYYRLSLAGNNATSEVVSYLQNNCHCEASMDAEVVVGVTQEIQHQRPRDSLLDLPASTLAKADAITRSDRIVYTAALHDFLHEVTWMESGLERRVLCDDALAKVEHELEYLGFKVTDVYHEQQSNH